MQLGRNIEFIKTGHWRRGLAVFLLVFTLFDLVLLDTFAPQFCDGEISSFSVINTPPPPDTLQFRTTTPPCSESPAQSEPLEEDCFCCCSHIIPSPFVSVAHLNLGSPPAESSLNSLPSAPPRDAFHPPRIAV